MSNLTSTSIVEHLSCAPFRIKYNQMNKSREEKLIENVREIGAHTFGMRVCEMATAPGLCR